MSEENVATIRGVRTPVAARRGSAASRRTLEERILVRFPAVSRALASTVSRLSPHSRLRQALLSRRARQLYAAASRRDFDSALTAYDPSVELRFVDTGGLIPPDMVEVRRGHEGFRHGWELAMEAVKDLRMEPKELIDAGDRLLVIGNWTGHGTGSGVPFTQPFFQVATLRRGMVIRDEVFNDRTEALEAAGLSE